MGLGLKFLLQADAESAHENIERLESATESVLSAVEGKFSNFSSSIVNKLGSIVPSVGIVSAAVAGLGTVITGLALHSAEYGEQIYTAAVKTGFSAQQLSGLAAVSKQVGENFDSLVMALGRAQRNIGTALAEPTSLSSKALLELAGGSERLKKILAEPGGTGDAIELLLHKIFELQDPTQRNLELQALLGRGWMSNTKTLQFLAHEGFEEAAKKAREFGMLLDDRQVAQAHTFVEQMDALKAELHGIALRLGQELIPMLLKAEAVFAGTIPTIKEYGYAIAGGVEQALGNSAKATEFFFKAHQQGSEALQAQTNALIKQQDQLNEALKNMHDPANRATLDLEKLGEHMRTMTEEEIEDAERLELLTARLKGYTAWLEKSAEIEERHLDRFRGSQKEYDAWVRRTMEEQTNKLQSEREKQRKILAEGLYTEGPEEKSGVISEEQGRQIEAFNNELNASLQKQSAFTRQAAEQWKEYYQVFRTERGAITQATMAVEQLVTAHQRGLPVIIAFGKALSDEGKMAEEAAKKQIASQAESLLSHIISRKAMAVIETVVQSAEGFASLAAHQYWSAAMHFMSAAEWGIVAGKSGGKQGGGGGGGERGQSESATRSGVPGTVGIGGEGGGGSSSGYHQSVVNIYGGQITDTHNLQRLVETLNSGGNSGIVKMNTGGSSYSIPNPAY